MRAFLSLAAAVMLTSIVSTASAEPTCVTPCAAETPTKMRSVPVFVTGVVFDVVGAAALAGGTGVVLASHDCGPEVSCSVSGTVVDLIGIAAMAGGAIFLSIGIPLTVVGAKSVPDVQGGGAKTGRGSGLVWTF
jgi:hypothetical protein